MLIPQNELGKNSLYTELAQSIESVGWFVVRKDKNENRRYKSSFVISIYLFIHSSCTLFFVNPQDRNMCAE